MPWSVMGDRLNRSRSPRCLGPKPGPMSIGSCAVVGVIMG